MNQTEQIFCNGPIVTLEEGPAPSRLGLRRDTQTGRASWRERE